jgi:hypothetical protein
MLNHVIKAHPILETVAVPLLMFPGCVITFLKLFYSCPSKRHLDIADEESGVETASRSDMARFKVTTWTDAPCSCGSPSLLFANDDNDLLMPRSLF